MNNWKIGTVSGLIAGIVGGIVSIITAIIFINSGLQHWNLPFPPIPSLMYIVAVTFSFAIIWGIVLGLFYSRFYDFIPGKNIVKGLIYGIILWLILSIRAVSFNVIYEPLYIFGNILSISEIIVFRYSILFL